MANIAESPQKKICKNAAWFEDLVAWIRSSPNGFVLEDSIEYHEQTRTLCTARKIAAGEILFRIPVVASGTTDAQLAWYLATCPETISPYLASLPNEILLPRDTPEYDKLISGSPVLSHIVLSRKQIRGEFDNLSNDGDVVSWSTFSHYYNAVTSRAFDGPVMVPLLDLCNHSRGVVSTKKNVSYEFPKENDATTFAVVTAAIDIPNSAPLIITYGAQPNAQLYVNYGFCVVDNTEPDGSSNDIFEWEEGVTLRMGPRSYTYGPLVKALDRVSRSVEDSGESGDGSDLEAFLNECEDEEDNEFVDCYSNSLDEPEIATAKTEDELGALRSLHKRLVDRSMKYNLEGKRWAKGQSVGIEKYATILVRSELKILYFYTLAIYKIEMMLAPDPNLQPTLLLDLEPPETDVFNEQASDLADAYMRIRHPSVQSSASVYASTLKA